MFKYTLVPYFAVIILAVVRLFFSVEFWPAFSILSFNILAFIFSVLRFEIKYGIKVYHILNGIWFFGIFYNIIIGFANYRRIRKEMLANSSEPKMEIQSFYREKSNRMNIKNPPALKIIPKEISPMIIGLKNPMILLPNLSFSVDELEYILGHELVHYRDHDVCKKFFLYLLGLIFWWNPFMKVFIKDTDDIIEMKTDIKAIEENPAGGKEKYLLSITKILKTFISKKQEHLFSPYLIQNSQSGIKLRFHYVLNYDKRKLRLMDIGITILSILIFILSYTFILKPAYLPPPEEEGCDYYDGEIIEFRNKKEYEEFLKKYDVEL